MRTTALVLGIVAGVFGIIAGLLAMTVGGIGSAVGSEGSGTVVGLGMAAIFLSVLAIVGGALAGRHPGLTAIIELVAGIGGFIAISFFWILSGPLLIVGALLAFLSWRSTRSLERRTATAE